MQDIYNMSFDSFDKGLKIFFLKFLNLIWAFKADYIRRTLTYSEQQQQQQQQINTLRWTKVIFKFCSKLIFKNDKNLKGKFFTLKKNYFLKF